MRFLFTLLLVLPWLGQAAEPDLLEPGKAFQFSARLMDAHTIAVRYKIAKGYYMYRDKFRFAVDPATVHLGAPRLPDGERKSDPFFGELEIYRDAVEILLPVQQGGTASSITLTAVSQGCADVGVCYVPQEQKAELTLASLPA